MDTTVTTEKVRPRTNSRAHASLAGVRPTASLSGGRGRELRVGQARCGDHRITRQGPRRGQFAPYRTRWLQIARTSLRVVTSRCSHQDSASRPRDRLCGGGMAKRLRDLSGLNRTVTGERRCYVGPGARARQPCEPHHTPAYLRSFGRVLPDCEPQSLRLCTAVDARRTPPRVLGVGGRTAGMTRC
jgi:hypothetical protein